MIYSPDIYYQNSNPARNFNISGKEFCIFFEREKVFQLFKDGTRKLIFDDRPDDQAIMEIGLKTGEIKRVNLKEFLDETGEQFYYRN